MLNVKANMHAKYFQVDDYFDMEALGALNLSFSHSTSLTYSATNRSAYRKSSRNEIQADKHRSNSDFKQIKTKEENENGGETKENIFSA